MAGDEGGLYLTKEQRESSSWVRIELTPEQRRQVAEQIGEEAEAIELPVRMIAEETPRVILRKDLAHW
jgi:hypothetical protein